jgi:hypothetical protein
MLDLETCSLHADVVTCWSLTSDDLLLRMSAGVIRRLLRKDSL